MKMESSDVLIIIGLVCVVVTLFVLAVMLAKAKHQSRPINKKKEFKRVKDKVDSKQPVPA